jgi:hypothetical protein
MRTESVRGSAHRVDLVRLDCQGDKILRNSVGHAYLLSGAGGLRLRSDPAGTIGPQSAFACTLASRPHVLVVVRVATGGPERWRIYASNR